MIERCAFAFWWVLRRLRLYRGLRGCTGPELEAMREQLEERMRRMRRRSEALLEHPELALHVPALAEALGKESQ
jgi:hypothetical protein